MSEKYQPSQLEIESTQTMMTPLQSPHSEEKRESTQSPESIKEKIDLKSLQEVKAWVEQRGTLFAEKLAAFADLAKKTYGLPEDLGSREGVFIGADLCIIASEQLSSGIGKLIDFNNIQPWLVSLTLNPLHQVVKLIDMQSGDYLLLDPTYQQINQKFQDCILVCTPDEISSRYSPEITGQQEPKIIEESHSSWGLKNIPPDNILKGLQEIEDTISSTET